MSSWTVVHIHPNAPLKPAVGEPCNGCGLCCLAEPCPLGMVLSRRRKGACRVLQWDDTLNRYVCGALNGQVTHSRWLSRLWAPLVRRWIAAGRGCDADLQASQP